MSSIGTDGKVAPREPTIYASSSSGDSRGRAKGRNREKRTRSGGSRPIKQGYHTFIALGHEFCIEKRWKYLRELGSGAYGVVVSVQDEITGETVAIKLITRVFDKIQLSKRALREITLLRHFNNHDNITGLIDMDVVGPDFNEIYLFMEPMEADLYQIIRSGQTLTDAHIRYFTYQILRGVKFIHSAGVVHRDLKPGNLLVNSDCELKICDMGLSRGFDMKLREDEQCDLTEYVATRWYRAPEILLSFKRYHTAIDMWSIGCILGELMGGKPVFKGKDYVDQLNLILDVLGTPGESIKRIGSDKARGYVRSLPFKKPKPWSEIFPNSDPDAVDLLSKLLTFDPSQRLTVNQALDHPFLAAYHDLDDEPDNSETFEKWRDIEQLETTDQFRAALWKEVLEFRAEVRSITSETPPESVATMPASATQQEKYEPTRPGETFVPSKASRDSEPVPFPSTPPEDSKDDVAGAMPSARAISRFVDPYRSYARRTSILSNDRREVGDVGSPVTERAYTGSATPGTTAKPLDGEDVSYFVPARSRAVSTEGDVLEPQLLRQLSTTSITRSTSIGDIGPGKEPLIEPSAVAADAPPSTMPSAWPNAN